MVRKRTLVKLGLLLLYFGINKLGTSMVNGIAKINFELSGLFINNISYKINKRWSESDRNNSFPPIMAICMCYHLLKIK